MMRKCNITFLYKNILCAEKFVDLTLRGCRTIHICTLIFSLKNKYYIIAWSLHVVICHYFAADIAKNTTMFDLHMSWYVVIAPVLKNWMFYILHLSFLFSLTYNCHKLLYFICKHFIYREKLNNQNMLIIDFLSYLSDLKHISKIEKKHLHC